MRVGTGAMLAASSALLFGSLGVFVKLAYAEGWNASSLLAARFFFATLTLLPFALVAKRNATLGTGRDFLIALAIGGIGYTATTAFYFPSIRYLPAAVASFLLYLAPAIVALLSWLLLRERLGRKGWAALAIAMVGLAVLSSGALTGALSLVGVALAAGSAVTYAVTTVVARGVAQRMHWSGLTLGVSLGATLSWTLIAAARGELDAPRTGQAALWAVAIGVLATGVSLSLFFAALGRTSASQVSVISTLEPVSTLVLAAIFLTEIPGPFGFIGGALIVVGAALIASIEPITAPHE